VIPQAHITAWRATAPWVDDAQVEQDLVLSRAVVEFDELLGTKLRALYQRRKGRDVFDLWRCLNRELVDANRVVKCFLAYMEREGASISRAEFERTLHEKQKKPSFLADLIPLLAEGVTYDAATAMTLIRKTLIERLPGEPWRGPMTPNEIKGPQESPRRTDKRKP